MLECVECEWRGADRWSIASHAFAEVIGRMDQLVDAVYDRYKDRYFPGEKVFVDLSGDK